MSRIAHMPRPNFLPNSDMTLLWCQIIITHNPSVPTTKIERCLIRGSKLRSWSTLPHDLSRRLAPSELNPSSFVSEPAHVLGAQVDRTERGVPAFDPVQ